MRVLVFLAVVVFTVSAYENAHQQVDPSSITDVYVVFSNHLDVGFGGGPDGKPIIGYAYHVINRYFDVYFPLAIKTANDMRKSGTDRYIWTTQSWLVDMYLDCPSGFGINCPEPERINEFKAAVSRGDITYHAFPFNSEIEAMDTEMFEFGIEMTHRLDGIFNKSKATVLSQRDVPGTTRAIIPILQKHGVTALSLGVNGFSAPPGVPKIFIWKDPDSGTSILGMAHPAGYGGIHVQDAVMFPGCPYALIMDWRNDNAGPATMAQAQADYQTIRSIFPNARVFASTFDQYVKAISPWSTPAYLPVFDQEMGDTWIYGIGSDPLKMHQMRAMLRARRWCIANSNTSSFVTTTTVQTRVDQQEVPAALCETSSYSFHNFSRLLLKASEHTWGGDVANFLAPYEGNNTDYFQWSNQQFSQHRNDGNITNLQGTWDEQRRWGLDYALQALPESHPLHARCLEEITKASFSAVDLSQYSIVNAQQIFTVGNRYELGFSSSTGAITHFVDKYSSPSSWANDSQPLASVKYQTLSQNDFEIFLARYGMCDIEACPWGEYAFGKARCSEGGALHSLTSPKLANLYRGSPSATLADSFVAELILPDELHIEFGAPAKVYVNVSVPTSALNNSKSTNGSQGSIIIEVSWNDKTPTRLPEAMWLQFAPSFPVLSSESPSPSSSSSSSSSSYGWRLHKLSSWVDPQYVIAHNSSLLHSVQDTGSVRFSQFSSSSGTASSSPTLEISSLDTGLVKVGAIFPLPAPFAPAPADEYKQEGVSFNLFNNVWGTNYVMWYPYHEEDKATKYRFTLSTTAV